MTAAGDRPQVHIVDSLDTSGVGDEIIRGLDALGVDAAAPPPDDVAAADGSAHPAFRAVVVLLSQRSFDDPVWRRRVEALRGERLVPVLAGPTDDHDVPPFLAELNWVIYRPGDASFFARLFTGINTDASRFRDAQDTRALAERWIGAGKSRDFLLEDRRELRRRIRAAATGVDGRDPLLPVELASALVGGFRERYRTIAGILSEGDDPAPKLFTVLASLWMATFRGIYAKEVAQSSEPVVAFLGSSQLYTMGLQRQRVWRATYRSALAVAAVVAVVVSVVSIRQALLRSTNAVAFAFVDAAASNRPDLAAIKAGASLADSESFGGSDGRLRLAADALSQHWPLGYLTSDGWGPAAVSFGDDGSIIALDNAGSLWTWNIEDGTRTSTPSGVTSVAGGDIASDGSAFIATDGSVLQVGSVAGSIVEVPDLSDIRQLRLAPADDRALIQAGNTLYSVAGIDERQPTATGLGTFDDVLDVVQTTDGRALALAVRDDDLYLVRDDGEARVVAPAPAGTSNGALAPSGEAFVIEADQVLWTSGGGVFASSGVRVPGVVTALAISDDGLVVVSDRTRGTWAADPALGVELGAVCNGFAGTSSLTVDARGERVVCLQASFIAVDDLAQLRPAARDVAVPAPTTSVRSDGALTSLTLVDGLIRLDRADGTIFALDSAGISLTPGYEPPASIADADFFATGALIGATGTATTVAATPAGDTFAIGFADGRVIEVDLEDESMSRVGTWQLPDHAAVSSIDWSEDLTEIEMTTATGTQWSRSSCAGCWNRDLLTERIAERVWFCYPRGDIDALGDSARALFRLRDCETRWEDGS